jgi:hypothetical protein
MGTLVLSGDTSGSITLDAPAVAGSSVQTLVAATGTLAPLISDTAKSATGTAVDFTGIPSWVRRITVQFAGVSTNGVSQTQIQIGSGSFTTSGYASSAILASNAAAITGQNSTTGFLLLGTTAATVVSHGAAVLSLVSGNTWVLSSVLGRNDSGAANYAGGSVTISGVLDRVRVTTFNGTDTFDAGTINIMYE